MFFDDRTICYSSGSIINLSPNTDYLSYTSIKNSDQHSAMKNDIEKVANDLKKALISYESATKR